MRETTERCARRPGRRRPMRDLRRIPLPPTGWTVRACGDAADSVAPFGAIEVPPFTHASIHAVLDRAVAVASAFEGAWLAWCLALRSEGEPATT